MLGKVAPYLFVGLAEMALILLAMRFGFGVPIRGSLVFLFAMAIVYLFALLSLGLFISHPGARRRRRRSRWRSSSFCRRSS